jgi:hypothetical protein
MALLQWIYERSGRLFRVFALFIPTVRRDIRKMTQRITRIKNRVVAGDRLRVT